MTRCCEMPAGRLDFCTGPENIRHISQPLSLTCFHVLLLRCFICKMIIKTVLCLHVLQARTVWVSRRRVLLASCPLRSCSERCQSPASPAASACRQEERCSEIEEIEHPPGRSRRSADAAGCLEFLTLEELPSCGIFPQDAEKLSQL